MPPQPCAGGIAESGVTTKRPHSPGASVSQAVTCRVRMWHFHSATCHQLPGPTWTTPASSPAAPPLAPARGASPPCNSPLASRGGHWGSGVSKPPRPQVGWGSVAGHTTRQRTELERTLVGGKEVNTRPLRGRGLWAETQDAHALHGSLRGDASDPIEPREKSVPCLSACHSRAFPPRPSPSPSACTAPA